MTAVESHATVPVAILFADISGSTHLYESLGDARARRLIARCIALMIEATEKQGGTLIKTIGDEVMCRFPGADQAAAAALDMQERVAGASVSGNDPNLAIHVGFHCGEVVEEAGDVFGDAVNVAARMVNLSKRDQILTTGATVGQLSANWREATRQVDRAAVRGKKEEIDVFELIWQEAEATHIVGKAWAIPQAGPPGRLALRMGAHEIEVSPNHPSVAVGRAEHNDLVLAGERISRLHARIEYRNGRFALTDQSSNGSYVLEGGANARLVRHDTQVLAGSGTISFGRPPEPGQADLVHYTVTALDTG